MGVVDAAAEAEEAAGLSRRANHKALKQCSQRQNSKKNSPLLIQQTESHQKVPELCTSPNRATATANTQPYTLFLTKSNTISPTTA